MRGRSIRCNNGFTVLELLTTMLIMGVVTATSVPRFADFTASFQRRDALSNLLSDLRRLRLEAVAAGARTVLRIDAGGNTYSLGYDYLPYSSTGTADAVFLSRLLPTDFNLSGVTFVLFDSRGYAVTSDGAFNAYTITMRKGSDTFAYAAVSPAGTVRGYQ